MLRFVPSGVGLTVEKEANTLGVSKYADEGMEFLKREHNKVKDTGNMNIAPVGPDPTRLTCSSCGATIISRVERKATTKTHIIALVLCLFLCWPCVCVPYCMNSCQNADHYCPNCNAYLGTYQQ
ncbi:Lipopolysaccharide-induced tumor necrosis factor-alpha factor [Papilio machaon]|uniref:Lipopolysaccharide-induced tumor necrosis factor-alpha factor n=1 Tax=Papilio machaon TaxID=76193 RepID=A0A194RSS6_PAPMA|nr:Lipopolysaccharide-induced tumor necrosis factor-alpha factor [Papilio machaon]